MKINTVSKEVTWIDTVFRITKHLGSNLIEIEQLVPNGFWGKSQMVYKRVYMGHIDPLRDAVEFFDNPKP